MKIVFNSSPLLFLSRLGFLGKFLDSDDAFYLPVTVQQEINANDTFPYLILTVPGAVVK